MPEYADTQLLKRRFEAVRADRSSVTGMWDQVERWVLPLGGSGPGDPKSNVEWERTGIWDFTAIDGNQKLAANIHGTVTSPAIRWFKFSFRAKELLDDAVAREWLDQVSDIAFDVLQDSDFNTEVASGYQEYSGYGNMLIICEVAPAKWGDAWGGLDFTAVPIREGYFEEDSRGGLYRFYRHLRWTAVQMMDKWGADKLPEKIREALAKDDSGVTKYDVVFAIYHRKTFALDPRTKRPLYPAEKTLRPVGSCYFLLDSGEMLGEEDGYYEMPAFLARWERTGKSALGHGPGVHSLPTVRYLNAMCELIKLAAAKAVDPTTFVTENGLLSDFDFAPSKVMVGRSKDDVWQMENKGNFPAGDQTVQDLRVMVRQIFHADDLQLKESPEMTATEAQIRYELMQRVLGSTLARLQSEFLAPLLSLVVATLFRAGRLPKAPPQVQKAMDALDLNIEYQGPLARAQRTDEVAAIERLTAMAIGMIETFPEVRAKFKPLSVLDEAAKRLGTPATLLESNEAAGRKVKEQEDLANRMAQAEAARAEGEAGQQGADAVAAARGAGAVPPTQVPVPVPGIGSPVPVASPAMPPLM